MTGFSSVYVPTAAKPAVALKGPFARELGVYFPVLSGGIEFLISESLVFTGDAKIYLYIPLHLTIRFRNP